MDIYLGFLLLFFYPCYLSTSALAGGKVCRSSLKSLYARQLLPRQCQCWHNSPSWQDCQWNDCAGEQVSFWCHFFLLLDLFLLMQQNLCQTPWPHPGPAWWAICYRGSVATGVAGLAEAWHWYGDKERCGVQSEHVGVKQSIAKTQWEPGMFSFEWILCLWNRGAF